MHNIICFETEWLYNSHKGNQFNLETKLLLDCLRNFYKCDIIHRHILYREDLQYYMDYFTTKRKFVKFDKYDIIYFACHGRNHTISFALEFKKQTGAKLVTGYSSSVDAMRSAIADMAYFNELMHIKNVGVILNDTSKICKTYQTLLEELKFTRI